MMRFRFTLGTCALALLALSVHTEVQAQQDPQSSTYFSAPRVFNPAYSGLSSRLNVHSVTRMQWVGWGGAPATQMLTLDAPFFREFGGAGPDGGSRQHRCTQPNLHHGFRGSAHSFGRRTMSFGISGGMRYLSNDFRGLQVDGPATTSTPRFQDWSPNFGAGMFVTSSKAYIGYSIPHVLTQELA